MAATEPQPVLVPPQGAAIFLVVTVRAGAEADVLALLADVPGLVRAVGFRTPELELGCVVGIGSDLWDRLYPEGPRPKGLHRLPALAGDRHAAPSTPGDLLFHVRGQRMDGCFELAHQVMRRLAGRADVVDEVHGFRSYDERDLLGFVDGTENPAGAAAVEAVQVGAEDPTFAGSSYVIVQKYLHDLDAWNALAVEAQEQVIGRTKLDDIELPDDVKPLDSHVAVNTIVDPDGTERQIVRQNMPFGTLGTAEFGTYFIGYAADPDVIERMLRRMFIGEPAGRYDRILDVSTAVTGSLYFVPTVDLLEDPGPVLAPDEDAGTDDDPPDEPPPTNEPPPTDGSLGIGSLRTTRSAPS